MRRGWSQDPQAQVHLCCALDQIHFKGASFPFGRCFSIGNIAGVELVISKALTSAQIQVTCRAYTIEPVALARTLYDDS